MFIEVELVRALYIGATVLFILTLGGLSHQESSRKGNMYGMLGMAIAIIATLLGPYVTTNYLLIISLMFIGGSIGLYLAKTIQMTQMPELVAVLHSLVGLAAVLVGYVNFFDETIQLFGVEKAIHNIEIYVGVFIGAITFSGSLIAFGKLSGIISGNPLLLPARHWLNLIVVILIFVLGHFFSIYSTIDDRLILLALMTFLALIFGVHLVMAIGGADMPVVVSMLNSYSGWAAPSTGFMLSNEYQLFF